MNKSTFDKDQAKTALDSFILRAGFTYGWENLESWARRMAEQAVEELAQPIDMILHCPACHMQHIDAPECNFPDKLAAAQGLWTNPPHRSHLCHGCGHIWRPADVPTNGVAAIKTKGKSDA